jgi:hypothetical protein
MRCDRMQEVRDGSSGRRNPRLGRHGRHALSAVHSSHLEGVSLILKETTSTSWLTVLIISFIADLGRRSMLLNHPLVRRCRVKHNHGTTCSQSTKPPSLDSISSLDLIILIIRSAPRAWTSASLFAALLSTSATRLALSRRRSDESKVDTDSLLQQLFSIRAFDCRLCLGEG